MKEYVKKLPLEIQELLRIASACAVGLGMELYLVGGIVRDLCLGVDNLDLDLVVEGDGLVFAERFSQRLKAKVVLHKRFGTATILSGHHRKIDIATARSEVYPFPASLPVVSKGNIHEDLMRRDFTVNAMAISLREADFGKLIDVCGSQDDLRAGVIRVLHEKSFSDDPTRILRAIRFACRYGFRIEPDTRRLLKKAVSSGLLEKVQPHRVRDEFILMLKEIDPVKEIKVLSQLTGFAFLSRKLKVSLRTHAFLRALQGECVWFHKAYPHRRRVDVWLVFAMGLFQSLDEQEMTVLCRQYAFLRGEQKRMNDYKRVSSASLAELMQPDVSPQKIFSFFEPLSYEAILTLKAQYRAKRFQKRIEDFFEIYNGMKPFLKGEDLNGMGILPGPFYKRIFTEVLQAKLNGTVNTIEEEVSLIRSLMKSRSSG